ncbi:D-isomer specific 2-hydroxyacid dehydrogenase, NAD-binding protein [Corchorus olitorius]|uniref:D-isomer specific 2-hydroxyacid dehydrogenase, NAD-binding protein n=1 Tax=Corchorus olitorius TaxID=93759 RepID=A0A1R3K0F5_9ROSI|nr:D-isomer specific 2-hydroxyacid dehydrogenase, NAD-binding protein [Corchorus olitorius]
MAAQTQTEPPVTSPNDDLPYVLILKKPPTFHYFGDHSFDSPKYHLLKAYESPLPLPQFLLAHAQSLGGKRVGIVGLGSIGTEVAKRLEAFGCTISYNSRKKKPCVSYTFYPHVVELAANCDVLIICCALTDETYHLIDNKVLTALGENGVIVNIARGPIIDEKELVRCLVQGEIGGAGLDVFEHEPDVPTELFGLDNVVMSPHNAVFTNETFEDRRKLVVGNLEAFFSNEPLLTPVSLDDQPHFSGELLASLSS